MENKDINKIIAEQERAKEKPETSLGIASLVFSILSLVSHFITLPMSAYFPFIGLFLALGDKVKNKKMTAYGKIGLIISVAAYAITVAITLLTTFLIVAFYVLYFFIFIILAGFAA